MSTTLASQIDEVTRKLGGYTEAQRAAAEATAEVTAAREKYNLAKAADDTAAAAAQERAAAEAEKAAIQEVTALYKQLWDLKSRQLKFPTDSQEYRALGEQIKDVTTQLERYTAEQREAAEASATVTASRNKFNMSEAAADQARYNALLREHLAITLQIIREEGKHPESDAGRAAQEKLIADLQGEQLRLELEIKAAQQHGLSNNQLEADCEKTITAEKNKQNAAEAEKLEQTKKTTSELSAQTGIMGKMLDSIVRYASFAVMSALQNAWRDTLQYVKEYHDALNEIRIVTNGTEADASNMGRTFVEMAKRLSVNSSEIAGAAVEFYRQGLSDSEVNSRLEWTIKYAKIAGLEFQEAAEIITAATNSMEIDVQRAADVFTYLGDASASGADEIGIAMQRASASAMEAGVSFEWLGAYIATVSEKTRQAPEVIGTAFNSIMARLHSIKSTGFNEEDATRINDVAKALATLPQPLSLINELTGEWVDMSTLFEQIAEQWDDLSDKQRAYIATTMAGTRQQNVFLTLMNDMAKAGENASRAYELYAGAVNASGTVTQKYSVYQESVTASLDSLTAAWQGFVNLIADGSVFSSFYGFLEKLVDLLTAGTEATHGINLGILAVAAACAVLVPAILKVVTAIKSAIAAVKAGDAVLSASKIGMIISVVLSLVGVITTLVAGMHKANEEAKKIDYSKAKTGIEGNIKTLENLIGRYEELAGKTSLTVAEEEEMRDIMNEIALLSPKYAQALSDAQGNVTASIEIANQALQDQLDLLLSIEAVEARNKITDAEYIKNTNDELLSAGEYLTAYK